MEFVTQKEVNIYFFGCWNTGFCSLTRPTSQEDSEQNEQDEKEKIRGTGLTSTMATLTQRVKTYPHPDFIIVAGDNYYPQKDNSKNKTKDKTKTQDKPKSDIKKTKKINMKSLQSGFTCLKNAVGRTKTILLLGNHDIDPIEDCRILNFQKEFVKRHTNFRLFNFDDFEIYKRCNEHTLIIMLDSTIFDDKEDTFECYEKFPVLSPDVKSDRSSVLSSDVKLYSNPDNSAITEDNSFQKSKKHQQEEKIEALQRKIDDIKEKLLSEEFNTVTNIVFTAHHPIYGIKEKKEDGKIKHKPDAIPKFIQFLYDNFFSQYGSRFKYYHLCADVHNYNHMSLTIKTQTVDTGIQVEQYIVGTGGADKDKYTNFTYKPLSTRSINTSSVINERIVFDIEYVINDYTSKNGFLHITISYNDRIDFKFIKKENKDIRKTRRQLRRHGSPL